MAISDEIRHQRKRLKGKGWKAYVSYFFTYYTWHVVGAIVAIIAVWSIASTVINHKDQALGVIFLNAQISSLGSSDYQETIAQEFASYIDLDTDTYEVVIDASTYMTPGVVSDSYDISVSEKVSVQAAAGTLDAIVADASNFKYFTYSLAFSDLREVLSEEEIETYADRIYYVDLAEVNAYQEEVESAASTDGPMTAEEGESYEQLESFTLPDPTTMQDPVPVGIVVTDAPVIKDADIYPNVAVIYGFVQSSGETQNAISFLEYLFQE